MAVFDILSRPFEPNKEDAEFLDWYSNLSERANISPDPDDPRHYYDYRAAYKEGVDLDESRHLPSRFKHDLHPDRYIIDKEDLSIYDTKYERPAKFEDMIIQAFKRKEYEEDIWN